MKKLSLKTALKTFLAKIRNNPEKTKKFFKRVSIVIAACVVAAGVYFYIEHQRAKSQQLHEEAVQKIDQSSIARFVDKDRAAAYGHLVSSGRASEAAHLYKRAAEEASDRDDKLKILEEYRKLANLYGNQFHEIEAKSLYAGVMDNYEAYWAASSIAGRYGDGATQREYLMKAYESVGVPQNEQEALLMEDIEYQKELWRMVDDEKAKI